MIAKVRRAWASRRTSGSQADSSPDGMVSSGGESLLGRGERRDDMAAQRLWRIAGNRRAALRVGDAGRESGASSTALGTRQPEQARWPGAARRLRLDAESSGRTDRPSGTAASCRGAGRNGIALRKHPHPREPKRGGQDRETGDSPGARILTWLKMKRGHLAHGEIIARHLLWNKRECRGIHLQIIGSPAACAGTPRAAGTVGRDRDCGAKKVRVQTSL